MEITNLIDNFEAISAKIIACCNAPGVAVAIVTPKEILSLKTYGVRHLGKKEYVNQDTLFRVASLSKIFTSALVSKLNTANIIDLESPIKQYLPFIHISDHNHINRIKIKNLLSHTSGIATYSLESKAYLPISLNELIADLPTTRKVSEPGKMFHYQNVIFSLIAPIISKASSFPLAIFLQKIARYKIDSCT
ncbi:serine hydrolase domain-containing protein [Cardinium endosymbiont of Culicoides punctatus]|uniref:serine hydrolase domain-containing protein n=1 Tax=Cardinium endosymbiont of Culicoides punctatus TaxID=2304601 RepID=UPI00140514A5|nr:serine hydrolase domain-containing protein [Cardinium endosymbiont of Culicoides punctatus]